MDKVIVAIIQVRMESTRLPGKIMSNLCNKPMIYHVCNRLKASTWINKIIIATTDQVSDNSIEEWAEQNGITCYRGNVDNVLSRYYYAAKEAEAEFIVRITGDDPFKDSIIIDKVVDMLLREELDFACNNLPPSFPEGLDVEVFTFAALKKAFENSTDDFEKEHVTQYFYRNPKLFKIKNYWHTEDISYLRLTVDTQNDFQLASEIYNRLYINNEFFGFEDILSLKRSEPDLFKINQNENRSAMYLNPKI
jgi:spore coat polysaccharide biosynthesis protein SpsF